MEFNKYQSTLEELKLDSYPDEVQSEFMEFITTVPYVRNLISPDRPEVKDLPKDEFGRAIIDITNPPILTDTHYFTPVADYYRKYGVVTHLRPNSNPNSEYGRWLKEEVRRCWEGYIRPDGAWITGSMYFYLNYAPIILSKRRKNSKVSDRVVDFPFFWEGIWWRYLYWDLARENAKHCAEIAKRGAGKSYSIAGELDRMYLVGDNAVSNTNLRGVVIAYQKEYLTKDGTLNKFIDMINFAASNTQFPALRLKESMQELTWTSGYKDVNTGVVKGSQNTILGVSAKDDIDKVRGKRATKIFIEEFGNFPRVVDMYRVLLPSVQDGDDVFGQINMLGTGGSEGADFAGAYEIIYNPDGYYIQSLPNVYDKSSQGKGNTIFFFGAPVNRKGCYNEDGISDVTKAVLQICYDRYIVKYNTTDPMALTRTKAENPITLQEAIMRRDSSIFPVSALIERIDEIKSNPSFFDDTLVGDLVLKKNGTVDFVPTTKMPIRFFPHKDNNLEGAIEIFKLPEKDKNGKVFYDRYIASSDPFDDDSAETLSLGSTFILDLWTDTIVAEYTGRAQFADDYFEKTRLLCLFYNARLNYEQNKKGIYAYFSKMNCLYLLFDTFDYLRDKDLIRVKGGYLGNKSKGVNATAPINNYARTLIRDWLIKPFVKIETVDGEDKEVTIMNLQRIKNLALLIELSQWNPDGNYDRVSSLGMLMIAREDRMISCGGDINRVIHRVEDTTNLANDDFFKKNYDNRFYLKEGKFSEN